MASYYAVIKARSGLLLGGAIRHISCRYLDREAASAWAEQALIAQIKSGKDAIIEDIVKTVLPAEIGRGG